MTDEDDDDPPSVIDTVVDFRSGTARRMRRRTRRCVTGRVEAATTHAGEVDGGAPVDASSGLTSFALGTASGVVFRRMPLPAPPVTETAIAILRPEVQRPSWWNRFWRWVGL